MTHYDIITKLIGPITPVGCSRADADRFKNLEAMTELVDKLLFDITQVSQQKNSYEGSVAKAGKFADTFMQEVRES